MRKKLEEGFAEDPVIGQSGSGEKTTGEQVGDGDAEEAV
jgi:hypothetical protein